MLRILLILGQSCVWEWNGQKRRMREAERSQEKMSEHSGICGASAANGNLGEKRSGTGQDLGIIHVYSWASNLYFFSPKGRCILRLHI